jgi:hypothetical protein
MVTPQSAPPSPGRFVARRQGAIRVTATRPYLPISSRSVDRVILIFKSAWNFLPANRNSCYDAPSFLCNRAAFLDRAPRDSSLAPTRTGPLRSAAWGFLCGRFHAAMPKGSRIPGGDGDGAWDRARALNSTATAASRTRHFRLDRRRVAEGRPARLFGERKPIRNFPACKPLKYHKTAKYSGADAVMRKPPAGSRR